MKFPILLINLFCSIAMFAQPNCNIYKLENNETCFKACILAIEAASGQGTKASQLQFDNAIALCPNLDYAYFEKAVPYLKRGEFISWKKLIDKAVELNPTAHLGYRGWCRYQFVRDYEGAIQDFEKLELLIGYDIGYSINGDYHLNVAKALCHKALGERKKAIEIIENQLLEKNYSPMPYDYLHLGVLKMEIGDDDEAVLYLKKAISINDYLAESYYYLALIYKRKNLLKEFKENMGKAKTYYLKGYKRTDPYIHPLDKIYLKDIDKELDK